MRKRDLFFSSVATLAAGSFAIGFLAGRHQVKKKGKKKSCSCFDHKDKCHSCSDWGDDDDWDDEDWDDEELDDSYWEDDAENNWNDDWEEDWGDEEEDDPIMSKDDFLRKVRDVYKETKEANQRHKMEKTIPNAIIVKRAHSDLTYRIIERDGGFYYEFLDFDHSTNSHRFDNITDAAEELYPLANPEDVYPAFVWQY
jgi:hypothetical protein